MVNRTRIPIMSPSDFPPDCVLQPQKVARNQWLMICTDLLTFTLNGLEKYMMQEFLEIPLSTHKGISGTLFPEWKKKTIAQEEVPLVVCEDPPHPLLPWVMKPYIDNGHLSHDQRGFSYHLSRARVVVEDAYGCLKGWWRCL